MTIDDWRFGIWERTRIGAKAGITNLEVERVIDLASPICKRFAILMRGGNAVKNFWRNKVEQNGTVEMAEDFGVLRLKT